MLSEIDTNNYLHHLKIPPQGIHSEEYISHYSVKGDYKQCRFSPLEGDSTLIISNDRKLNFLDYEKIQLSVSDAVTDEWLPRSAPEGINFVVTLSR